MPATPLPPVLDEKLADLAAQVRRLLVVRGVGWVTLAALGGLVFAVGLDTAFNLSAWTRGALLLGWLTGCGWLAWRLVLRPWHFGIPATQLAGQIEREFPGLSERVVTLIELNQRADAGNGSPALMAVLAAETDQRTRRLDFARVAPAGSVGFAVLAGAVAVLVLTPLALVPGAGERTRRFVLPWYMPPADVAYRIIVSPGDAVVRRGEPVTLSAYLEPTRTGAALPGSASLVVRGSGSKEGTTLPMTVAGGAAFHLSLPGVAEDFEYRVEAGPAHSDWHTVAAADPIALADGSTLTVFPPGYAEGIVPPQTRGGFGEFDVLQYGRAALDLRFTAAPTEVYLEWRPVDPGQRVRIPVRLRDDRLAGTAEAVLPADGTLALVMIGDRGLRAEVPAAVRAIPDVPPRFEKVVGLTGTARDVHPNERVPIELAARDDLRLDSLRVEYSLTGTGTDVRSEPISLPGVGTNRAEGAFAFALTGKAKEGDTLFFRVRASDNRSVADQRLGPQHAVFPPTGWAVLRVTASARPLVEQEVLGQRHKVRDRLAEVTKLVTAAAADVAAVRESAQTDSVLTPDQAVRLRRSREATTGAGKLLGELANEIALSPDLRPVAAAARDVADGPLRAADGAVRAAETDATGVSRDKSLTTASEKLAETLARLTELGARNEAAAQTRLDHHTLRQIADDQTALAERAGKPDAPADELAKKQRDLLARLNEAIAHSPSLKSALEAAAGEQLHELLARARKLAEDQAELDRSVRDTEQTAQQQRTKDLTRRQQELAAEAARLAERTETAARVAGTAALGKQPFEQAVERLTRGDTDRALTEQEKAARELDRLAEGLARAAAARSDTREAARQIAHWQDDLRRRYAEAAPPSDDGRRRFAAEQQAVRDAVELLRLPNADSELAGIEQAARDAARLAAEALAREPAKAPAALQRSADALARLADRTPTAEDRSRLARSRLDELRKDQDAITRAADEAVRAAGRDAIGQKLDTVAARQDALAKKVRQLDLPGQEVRRGAVATAADRATADLRSGRLPDIPLSQLDVRRQLDRLRQALDGASPPDEQAVELAHLQREVADAADRLPAQPTEEQFQPVRQLQRDVSRRLGELTAPEAAGALAEARDAVEEARKAEGADELRKKSRTAAAALAKLAGQLAGTESDAERVERLARERASEVERARGFERQPARPEITAEFRRRLERQLDELSSIRAGKHQSGKRKAVEALQWLRQADDPARNVARQQEAADALRRFADAVARTDDHSSRPAGPPAPTSSDELRRLTGGDNLPTDRDAAAARDLARRQRELRDATSGAAVELARGVRPSADSALGQAAAHQQKRQDELAAEAGRLRDALRDAADGALGRAATATAKARDQMTQAGRDADAGRARQAAEARRLAGAALAEAVAEAAKAAGAQPAPPAVGRDNREAGAAARRAGDRMRQADSRLRKPNGDAAGSMRQAARELSRATAALDRALGGPRRAAAPKGDAAPPPAEVIGRLDKSWGELPGDVRAKVLQELAARYGEDYARSIKLYFESLAERK